MDFKTSKTKENLMRAFAGESQAYMRYTYAAEQAKIEKLKVVERVFRFTSKQEREHAMIFYKHLSSLAGEKIQIDGSYPVDIANTTAELLRMAQHNEYDEYETVYKSFGDIAKEEGFAEIAASFYMIADIEKVHGDRFANFAALLESGGLFRTAEKEKRICLNCGYISDSESAPDICPVCKHDKGYFIKLSMAPYTE